MPVITGFDKLASVPEEQITEKIGRRVISGKQGTMVYWRMKAGAHVAGHQHPQEQFVWVIRTPRSPRWSRHRLPTSSRACLWA
jgi:quercetin dioxygenase-like cupin family protein